VTGVAIGIMIPIGAMFLLRLQIFEGILGGSKIVLPISWASVLLALLVSCSTGLLFGYLPASRAAKLQPTESLRYE